LRIALWALTVAVVWSAAMATIDHSSGWLSTPWIWASLFGLPGVAIAFWLQQFLINTLDNYRKYFIMFLVNWFFYWSVIQGLVSVKRKFWK
jgi:hypothetical protein